jgi:hypothetical protein
MERCDAGILLLDAFGVDCGCEAGWFSARAKPLVGIAGSSCMFLQHWMVKGSVSGLVCLDATVFEQVRADPILRDRPAVLCEQWDSLAHALASMLAELGARRGSSHTQRPAIGVK